MRRLALIAAVVLITLPPAAQAAFSSPKEVAGASALHRGFVVAADASGRLTVATRATGGAPRLIERRSGGRLSDLPPVRGIASGVYRTSIAAAGDGALGVAWMVRVPEYAGIQVAVRDPGSTLSDPIEIAGFGAGGVDHPAIAVNAAGDALLAYQTGMLGLQGAIAIAYRPAGGASFIGPRIVDHAPSNPPVVALAQDGSGIVAWTGRRTLMAVTVASNGALGAVKRIAPRVFVADPVAAAGPRAAASVAYRVNNTGNAHRTSVRVLARPAGGTFGQPKTVFLSSGYVFNLALAADEQGRATLAWTESPVDRSRRHVGTPRLWIAAGRVGRRFRGPRVVSRRAVVVRPPVSLAVRHGHVALAWRNPLTIGVSVGAAVGRWNEPLRPQVIASTQPMDPVAVAVAGDGRASVFWRAGKLFVSDGP